MLPRCKYLLLDCSESFFKLISLGKSHPRNMAVMVDTFPNIENSILLKTDTVPKDLSNLNNCEHFIDREVDRLKPTKSANNDGMPRVTSK